MSPLRAVSLVLSALWLAGCAATVPVGEPSVDLEAAQAKAALIDAGPAHRTAVHALLGQPWLANERLGVEVHRLKGKQHNILLVFAPYPVPVPAPSDTVEAYTLVAYDTHGAVVAHASDVVRSSMGSQPTLLLRAGAFEFVHGIEDSLSVSLERYLSAHSESSTSHCSVLIGCDEARLAAMGDSGFCVCTANLWIDAGERLSLGLLQPAIIPAERGVSAAECSGLGGHIQPLGSSGAGACLLTPRALHPLRLQPGSHTLRFAFDPSSSGVSLPVNCAAGEVSQVRLHGEFMLCSRVEGGRLQLDRDQVGFVDWAPLDLTGGSLPRVLVYAGGTWLDQP